MEHLRLGTPSAQMVKQFMQTQQVQMGFIGQLHQPRQHSVL
jgi:hypothetical protein